MLINIIYNMPNWLLAFCIVSITVIIALVGIPVVHALLKKKSVHMENGIVTGLGHLSGIIFAIVVGFVAIAVLGAFDRARQIAEDEANQAFTIWVYSRVYPENFESKVRDVVESYLNVVIDDEWPKQSQGEISLVAARSFDDLSRLIIDYSPSSSPEQEIHNQILTKVNKIFEDRSSRKFINTHGLQETVYYEIIFSIIIILGFALCFSAKDSKGYFILTVWFAISIGLVFFLIVSFDYPFRGKVCIPPDAYKNALQHIERLKVEESVK